MKLEHTCYGEISEERLEGVRQYTTREVTAQGFADPATWRQLADIMVYHPNPITRHEACFVMAELHAPFTHLLVSIVKFDTSVVAKHEAVESLGKIRDREDAWMAYSFLRRAFQSQRIFDNGVYPPDVQATIQESIIELEEIFPDFVNKIH